MLDWAKWVGWVWVPLWSAKFKGNWFQPLDSDQSYLPEGEKCGDNELMPKMPELLPFNDSVGLSDSFGLMRFSFWRRLQYQTRTTSFSMHKLSARLEISSLVGFGFMIKALSRDTLTLVSIEVRFLRRRPIASGVVSWLESPLLPNILSIKDWTKNHRAMCAMTNHSPWRTDQAAVSV